MWDAAQVPAPAEEPVHLGTLQSLLGSPEPSGQLGARVRVGCEPPCCLRGLGRRVSTPEAGIEPGECAARASP